MRPDLVVGMVVELSNTACTREIGRVALDRHKISTGRMYEKCMSIHAMLMVLINQRSDMAVIRDRPNPELAGRVAPHHLQHLKSIIQDLVRPIEEFSKFPLHKKRGQRSSRSQLTAEEILLRFGR